MLWLNCTKHDRWQIHDRGNRRLPRRFAFLSQAEPPTIVGDGRANRDLTYIDKVLNADFLACSVPSDVAGRAKRKNRLMQTNDLRIGTGGFGVDESEPKTIMSKCLSDYYRCPERYFRLALKGTLSSTKGYFRFGRDAVCYGRYCGQRIPDSPANSLHDASLDTTVADGITYLPFDLTELVDNVRCEVYTHDWRGGQVKSALARLYYFVRPTLPFVARNYLKKLHLKGWEKLPFPRWPVDCSIDSLAAQLLQLSLRSNGVRKIPFIWFWPEGASSCAIMTHDVETESGQEFCSSLMDIDDSFGIKASFQIVPEERYGVSTRFLASVRQRGFEVVIHDLNHDGHLYRDREQFLQRAAKINSYGEQYGAEGFRAAVLYRKQLWFDALKFSYDMSVPNVAHLDPQQGGCCTVMPFFIGNVLELPVTTTQDYMLFYMLNDYSINLWKRQIEIIMEKHGLISFIVHPDYIMKARERAIYEELLAHLASLREKKHVWITTPGEVNRWWRQRAEMRLVEDGEDVRIEGAGSERARIAYASEQNGRLIFTSEKADCGSRELTRVNTSNGPGLASQ